MLDMKKEIETNGKKYPMIANINVFEAIQREYGALYTWQELISGEDTETDINALIFAFREMINEGIDIENDENGTDRPFLTHKQVGRIMSEMGLEKATEKVMDAIVDSAADEDPEKNV